MWLKLVSMLPFLGRLSGLKRLLPGRGVGLLLLALVGLLVTGWFWHQAIVKGLEVEVTEHQASVQMLTSERDQMASERDQWQDRAEQREADLVRVEQQRLRAEASVRALQKRLSGLNEEYEQLQRRIRQAPAADDGPVAPVLINTLEALP